MPDRAYRIGYLNPFSEKAENQAAASLVEGAARLGHMMIPVATSAQILAAELDFVISVATSQPKLTTTPTFAAIHEPKVRLCGEEHLFRNLLSYDGYLTISQTLAEFLGGLNTGFRRGDEVGFYYNTPQVAQARADLPAIVGKGELELCYFGTNWDRRARPLLRALALRPYMRIHGPEEAWAYLADTPSYKGSTPFDGRSVQNVYAKHGVGLVVLSREHRLDDVISNRIFEITSVGAVAICPDTPWIKANFGETVSYYSSDRSVTYNMGEIDEILTAITADPAAAAARADKARVIFETRFAAERMVASAIDHFERWKARAPYAGPADPVDVILRLNGASEAAIAETVASLQSQATGRVRLIVTGDTAQGVADAAVAGSVIEAVAVAGNASSLRSALALVNAPRFAAVDAGDVWTRTHLSEAALALDPAIGPMLAISRVVDALDGPADGETRRLRPWPEAGVPLADSLGRLGLEGLTAPSDLLAHVNLDAVTDGRAGDAAFLGLLLEHARPVYTHRPTTIARGLSSGGDLVPTFGAAENVSVRVLLGPDANTAERRLPCPLTGYWSDLSAAVLEDLTVKEQAEAGAEEANAVEGGAPVASIHERSDLVTKPLPLTDERLWGQAGTAVAEAEFGASVNVDLFEPHAYCASLDLKNLLLDGPQWIVAEFADITVPFRIGVVNRVTEEMIELDTVPALKDHLEVWLRIENPVPASFVIMAMDSASDVKLRLIGLWLAQNESAPGAAAAAA